MIILVDQDDVLADFHGCFCDEWQRQFGEVMQPTFYKIEGEKKDVPPEMEKRIKEISYKEGFFLNLPPLPNAIESVKEIALYHQVFICTRPLLESEFCLQEKKRWVSEHLGAYFVQRMLFVTDKTLVHGNYLIDDNPEPEDGLHQPTWRHIVYDRPYNQHIIDRPRIVEWQNWQEVLKI